MRLIVNGTVNQRITTRWVNCSRAEVGWLLRAQAFKECTAAKVVTISWL